MATIRSSNLLHILMLVSRMPETLTELCSGRPYLRKFLIYITHFYVQNLIEFFHLLQILLQLRYFSLQYAIIVGTECVVALDSCKEIFYAGQSVRELRDIFVLLFQLMLLAQRQIYEISSGEQQHNNSDNNTHSNRLENCNIFLLILLGELTPLLLLLNLTNSLSLNLLLHDLQLLQNYLIDEELGLFADTHFDTYYNMQINVVLMSVSIHQEGVSDAGVVAVVIKGIVEVLEVLFQFSSVGLAVVQNLEVEVFVPIIAQVFFVYVIYCVFQQLKI